MWPSGRLHISQACATTEQRPALVTIEEVLHARTTGCGLDTARVGAIDAEGAAAATAHHHVRRGSDVSGARRALGHHRSPTGGRGRGRGRCCSRGSHGLGGERRRAHVLATGAREDRRAGRGRQALVAAGALHHQRGRRHRRGRKRGGLHELSGGGVGRGSGLGVSADRSCSIRVQEHGGLLLLGSSAVVRCACAVGRTRVPRCSGCGRGRRHRRLGGRSSMARIRRVVRVAWIRRRRRRGGCRRGCRGRRRSGGTWVGGRSV